LLSVWEEMMYKRGLRRQPKEEYRLGQNLKRDNKKRVNDEYK